AGEHPGRRLAVALEGEHPGGVREAARQVLRTQEGEQVTVVAGPRKRDARDLGARQGLAGQRDVDLAVTYGVDEVLAGVGLDGRGPVLQERVAVTVDAVGDLRETLLDDLAGAALGVVPQLVAD